MLLVKTITSALTSSIFKSCPCINFCKALLTSDNIYNGIIFPSLNHAKIFHFNP